MDSDDDLGRYKHHRTQTWSTSRLSTPGRYGGGGVVKVPQVVGDAQVPTPIEGILRTGLRDLVETGAPDVLCSTLPHHWRSNKSLPCSFR